MTSAFKDAFIFLKVLFSLKKHLEKVGLCMWFLYLMILVVALIFDYFMAKWFYEVAEAKGYYERKYFHIAFWFGIAGYLLVIALPDRGNGDVVTNATKTVITTSEDENEAEKEEEDWSDMGHFVGLILPANIPSPVCIKDSKSNVIWKGKAGNMFRFEADGPVLISVVWDEQCRASRLVQPGNIYTLCGTANSGTEWKIL